MGLRCRCGLSLYHAVACLSSVVESRTRSGGIILQLTYVVRTTSIRASRMGERARAPLRLIGRALSSTLIDVRQTIINNLTLVGVDGKQTAVAGDASRDRRTSRARGLSTRRVHVALAMCIMHAVSLAPRAYA